MPPVHSLNPLVISSKINTAPMLSASSLILVSVSIGGESPLAGSKIIAAMSSLFSDESLKVHQNYSNQMA